MGVIVHRHESPVHFLFRQRRCQNPERDQAIREPGAKTGAHNVRILPKLAERTPIREHRMRRVFAVFCDNDAHEQDTDGQGQIEREAEDSFVSATDDSRQVYRKVSQCVFQ